MVAFLVFAEEKATKRTIGADMPEEAAYVLGHSEEELQRLQLQARCLEGPTHRLITECGIKPGMHVLDFGTGAGDVALLVAQAVGPSGAVVGVDQEERSVRTLSATRRRCRASQRDIRRRRRREPRTAWAVRRGNRAAGARPPT